MADQEKPRPDQESEKEQEPLELLQDAFAVYREWQEQEEREPPAELLSRHPRLRECLEALLLDGEGETAAEAELEGHRLGGFQLLRKVGQGGMGVVYEAWEPELDRRVALKVLPRGLTLNPAAVARFRREALTAARLDHPGLVKVYSFGSEGGDHFFTMEFVTGAPLNRVLRLAASAGLETLHGTTLGRSVSLERHRPRSAGPTPEEEPPDSEFWNRGYVETVLGLICQVADALDYAHQAGVVHRDVKPANILVRPDGSVVLTDFGLAKGSQVPTMTMTGDFLGTPYYVSPEQAAGRSAAVDGRSDIYSLGATLYELLTLKRPFEGDSSQEVLQRILGEPVPDPRRRNPRLPADLAAILLKAMARDPRERYQRAGDLAADLRAFLACRPVSARLASPALRLKRWVKREPLLALVVLLLALGVPALTGLGGYILARRTAIRVGTRTLHEREVEELLARGFYDFLHDYEEAEKYFLQVLVLDPGQEDALLGIAAIRHHKKRFAELLELADRMAPRMPAYPFLLEWLAEARSELGLPAKTPPAAAREIDPATQAFWTGHLLEANAFLTGRIELKREALAMIRSAIILSPRPRVFCLQAYFFLAIDLGRLDEAGEAATALERHWPGSRRGRLYRALVASRRDPDRARTLLSGLEEKGGWADPFTARLAAEIHQNIGDYAEAIRLYELDLARERDRPERCSRVHLNLGICRRDQGRPDLAEKHYRRALELCPDNFRAGNNLGHILLDSNRLEEAREILARVCGRHPRFTIALDNLAETCFLLGRLEEAVDWAQRSLALAPEVHPTRLLLALVLRHLDRPAEAEKQYRILLRSAAAEVRAKACDGMGLLHQEDPGEAQPWFHRAVEENPRLVQARLNLAIALINRKQPEKARPHLEKATGFAPHHHRAHALLLHLYRVLQKPQREKAELARWAELNPEEAESQLALAEFLLAPDLPPELRDPARALASAARAAALTGEREPGPLIALGLARAARGEREKALALADRAEKLLEEAELPARRRSGYEMGISRIRRGGE